MCMLPSMCINLYTAISHSENPAKHLDVAISPNGNPTLYVKHKYTHACTLAIMHPHVHTYTRT